MKKLLLLALLFGVCISSHATTWYIRHDGGTNIQCSGTTNAPYPGSGTGKACAYDHPYQLLNYWGVWNKIVANDTIQFSDPPTNTVPYYMGEQNGGLGMDWSATVGGICGVPNSGYPAGASCILPPLPNGVAIIGQNAGSCHTLGHTGLVNPTILSGISGAYNVIDLQGTDQITLNCLEITQPDNCTMSGGGSGGGCAHSANYISEAGIRFEDGTNQGPRRLTMTDVMVAGTAGDGIHGSKMNALSSDVSTATDIYIWGNGDAGVNSDGGGCGNGCESIGTWNINYIDVEANGCLLLKPFDNTQGPTAGANAFNYCFGQSSGGYGDGFVLIAAGNFTVNISNGIFKYNTQDGFDALHISRRRNNLTHHQHQHLMVRRQRRTDLQTRRGSFSHRHQQRRHRKLPRLEPIRLLPQQPIRMDCPGFRRHLSRRRRPMVIPAQERKRPHARKQYLHRLRNHHVRPRLCLPRPNCGSNGGVVKFINNISLGFPDCQ